MFSKRFSIEQVRLAFAIHQGAFATMPHSQFIPVILAGGENR